MKRKMINIISVFIFIFSFVGCSCKKEEVIMDDYFVPMSVAYLEKDINGRYTIVYPLYAVFPALS